MTEEANNHIVLLDSNGEEIGLLEYDDESFATIVKASLIHAGHDPSADISVEDESEAIQSYVNHALRQMLERLDAQEEEAATSEDDQDPD